MTREHVWGEWLRQIVPAEMNKHEVRAERIGAPGTPMQAEMRLRAGDPLSSTVKVVCAACNNGWLSQIQERAKPYLIPLIRGQPTALGPDGQRAVAAWCTMATMTGEYIDRDPAAIAVSQADRDHLMAHREAPPGWKVWIARYVPHRWRGRWLHFTVPILEGYDVTGDPADRLKPVNTQSTTFVIGQLVVHTLSSASQSIVDGWEWPMTSRLHRLTARISPPRESVLAWPSESLRDDDADWLANAFSRMIDAANRSMTGRRLF
jgi:hypothetical protein